MAEPELCPNCGRLTPTIGGRCPECWFAKHPEHLPAENPYKPRIFDDIGGIGLRVLLLTPGLTVTLIGVAIGSRTVLIIGGVVMAICAVFIRGLLGSL